MDVTRYQNLVEELLQNGLVSEQGIAKAYRLANRTRATSFPYLLLDLGLISELDLADQLAQISQSKRVLFADLSAAKLLDNIPERFLKEYSIASVYSNEDEIGIAVVDPYDTFISESLSLVLNKQVTVHVGVRSEVEKAVGQQCEPVDLEHHSNEDEYDAEDIENLRDIASEAPVIRYVNTLFQRAVEARASDIHLEAANKKLAIRLRIDGILKVLEQPAVGTTVGIISRIKNY